MKKLERFIENARIDSRLLKKAEVTPTLQEKINSNKKLTESYDAAAKQVWEVPISAYDTENANGRIYSRKLWENVINNQRQLWEGSPMLANHPAGDSDGSPSDICGIWLDARLDEDGFVYGKFIPSGDHGKNMEEHLINGLKAGTSSSGFGELGRDGKTVEASTYQIERLSDWVLNPSQGTYFTHEAKKTNVNSDSSIQESTNTKLKEGAPSMKISKLEEKKFRKDIKAFLEDTNHIEDPSLRLKELSEILSYFEEGAAPDLKELVEQAIIDEQDRIKEAAKGKKELQEELGIEGAADLKEKLGKIASEVTLLKEDALDWQSVSTKLQEKVITLKDTLKNRPTEAYVEHLRNRNKKLFTENNNLAKIIKKEEAFKKVMGSKKVETLELLKKTIAKYKETIAFLEKENGKLTGQLAGAIGTHDKELKEAIIKTAEANKEFEEYKEAENTPIVKRLSEVVSKDVSFREDTQIDSYWADLVIRHGKDIKPFEERIRNAKTLREAMAIYLKVLPSLNESVDYYNARIPESVSLSVRDRTAILEEKGMKIDTKSHKAMPKGWV